MAQTLLDARQSKLATALPMVGSAVGATLDTIFPLIDANEAKLFEDRNILITDGGTVTFTGTQLQFTEALNLVLNQKISGAVPQIISLAATTRTFTSSGDMLIAVISRTAGTATVSIIAAGSALPAASSANEEVFLIAKRVDAADGTQRLYFRNGSSLNAGQSVRLGQGGSGGSGSGTGDDLDALTFRASFTDVFGEASTQAVSSILTSGTNATFSAAKSMYTMQYDASKTVTGTSTAMTLSAAPAFTVAVGDVLIQGTEARKITAVASQTSYTIELAFTLVPSPTAAQATVSQAVYTKDIYNAALDGSAIATSFPGTTFSEIMVDYKDNATSGSNLWVPNLTPLVAFTATNTGTTFTVKQVRATNTTDTMGSTILPVAGSALSLRFFSNATSGSGFANLINYKTFMQKALTAISGGIMNSAYGFTNGAGTPVNASFSVIGGKTTVTLGWSYAVGAFSGTSESSIEVYVNGTKYPRYLDSVTTPDGSWVEVSSNVLALDRDYSQLNLSLNVIQRTNGQPVDSSTANVTAINQLQETSNQGFQAFVNTQNLLTATSTAGTPSAGTFYSTVQNRAALVDFTQDLKPRMGIDRIMTQQIVQLQTEFGPNGETVFSAVNDNLGQIRFVGNGWTSLNAGPGNYVYSSTLNDYVEITFYGTSFNMLIVSDAAGRDYRASIDGGNETANLYVQAPSFTATRNYSWDQVVNVASGLSLGTHTVKIRNNVSSPLLFFGFEVLNPSANVITSPGSAYVSGKKITTSAQSTIAYNAAVTGTTGGRMLMYQTAAGSVAQAFQANATTPLFLTAASHTNEEIVRTYNWREFGAGRGDDFSSNTPTSAHFTLDDGSTTLVASAVQLGNNFFGPSGIGFNANGYVMLTFVGTGLDIFGGLGGSSASTMAVSVDGISVGSFNLPAANLGVVNTKIASGLPYGMHTVRITFGTVGGIVLLGYRVYQPKTPTLPAGSVSLGSYNVLANYSAITASPATNLNSTGVLYKTAEREFAYTGTWGGGVTVNVGQISGVAVQTATVGDTYQFTFFGTGFEAAIGCSTSASGTVTIDGAAYTGAANIVGGATWTPGTSTFALTTSFNVQQLQVNSLTLGLHTVKITASAISGNFFHFWTNLITPIHSQKSNVTFDLQNTLTVGSQGIQDNRVFTPVKDLLPATKASAQAVGIANVTTTASSGVPMPDMSCTVKTGASKVRLDFASSWSDNVTNAGFFMQFYVDGVGVSPAYVMGVPSANFGTITSIYFTVPVSAGVHKFDLYWYTNASSTLSAFSRNFTVTEL